MGFEDIPLPIWYKLHDPVNDTFRMVYINDAYEREYGVDRVEYLGKQDIERVNPDIAKKWTETDRKAYWSRVPVFANEPLIGGDTIRVVKWRIDKGGETFIYGLQLEKT